MSEVFDVDELLEQITAPYKAKVGGKTLEFRRYGQMTAAERKKFKPLIEQREALFREAALLIKSIEKGENPERSMTAINDEVNENAVEQLKIACVSSAEAKKKLGDLPNDAVERLYADYTKRTELGEASPSSTS